MGTTLAGSRSVLGLASVPTLGPSLAVVAIALAGCAGEPDPAQDAPAASSTDALSIVAGSYRVPAPVELAAVATNPVTVAVLAANGGVRLAYDLPDVIAGQGARVVLTSRGTTDDGELELRGEGARATCTLEGAELVCQVTYKDELVDLEGAVAAIDRRAFSRNEAPLRLDVARRFSVDPLGVLAFPVDESTRDRLRPR